MTNGFENHGINHSSASNINMYVNAPDAWAARYLFGRKFNFALAAKAGVIVEDAVVQVVTGVKDLEAAVKWGVEEFNKAGAFTATDADRKRGEGIPAMIEQAVEYLEPLGTPEFDGGVIGSTMQKQIEIICNGDGWKLPIIGYLDFFYPDAKKIVDLKTTMRAPSVISDDHHRQGSIYKAAYPDFEVDFLYVTPKKTVVHTIENHEARLAEIKTLMNRQEKMLRNDVDVIKDIMPVTMGSFYWNGDEDIREELYGV